MRMLSATILLSSLRIKIFFFSQILGLEYFFFHSKRLFNGLPNFVFMGKEDKILAAHCLQWLKGLREEAIACALRIGHV